MANQRTKKDARGGRMTYKEKERICAKLRHTVIEHGRLPDSAVILSSYEVEKYILDHAIGQDVAYMVLTKIALEAVHPPLTDYTQMTKNFIKIMEAMQ